MEKPTWFKLAFTAVLLVILLYRNLSVEARRHYLHRCSVDEDCFSEGACSGTICYYGCYCHLHRECKCCPWNTSSTDAGKRYGCFLTPPPPENV
ncbi:hypothetical protein K2173_017051 [Erythroxylum novogranatense]|uniref:Uncharacterized protein n=1 Tax=Erythroxylum novogranatense TaxID=1862640 RepID=A0AAV8U8E1_9ROSI|nr:hypothetical protein K2173_017051 [Erythroxylum novogranatense]